MKAILRNHRIEEEWRIRFIDLLKACKIPVSHIHGLEVDLDEDFEDDTEECYDILIVRIIRKSKTDRKKERKKTRKYLKKRRDNDDER